MEAFSCGHTDEDNEIQHVNYKSKLGPRPSGPKVSVIPFLLDCLSLQTVCK